MSRYNSARSVYDLSFGEVEEIAGGKIAAKAFEQLYVKRRRSSPEISRLMEAAGIPHAVPLTRMAVQKGRMTTKYVFGVAQGDSIEAVRIKRRTGLTACVSSQVGCGFGCQFCASGRLGLSRHLLPGEIVQQVMELGHSVNRIVFMGIGEPLHNYDNVMKAIRILRDRRGLNMSTGGITISTIGIPDALTRLREEHLKVNLTISLHTTDDQRRHELIPGSKGHSVEDVVAASQSWALRHNRIPTYVYLILPGVNDSKRDLQVLQRWFKDRPARINLMRWNPVEGGLRFKKVDDRTMSQFKRSLDGAGIPTVVRDTQGHDIDAACGQLWLKRGSDTVERQVGVPQVRKGR